jgi:anti-anti-sigma factor
MDRPVLVLTHEAIRDHPDARRVAIDGSIDPKTNTQFKAGMDAVLATNAKRVLVDCAKLTYINSSGLAYLLNVVGILKPKGGSVALAGMDSKIQVIFKMMEITALFQFYPTYRDALQELDEKLAAELRDVGPALKLEEPPKPPPAPTPKPVPKTSRKAEPIPRTTRIPVPPPPPPNPFVQFFRWLFGGDEPRSGTTRTRKTRR